MNQPSSTPLPENLPPTENLKLKLAREAEQRRNREISHMLKAGSMNRHQPKRSMSHMRGK
jgi:hypothetical protein